MSHARRKWWLIGFILALAVAVIALCNVWIVATAKPKVFDNVSEIPAPDVALVLGTGRMTADGRWQNPHFRRRIEAAVALYRAGKVRHLLLSGDNHIAGYDEPSDMRAALLDEGVPASAITLDYAGFRTLDSVVRAKAIFGQSRLTIVSERFHNYRALFICRHFGIDAVAFNARPVSLRVSHKAPIREWFARVKAVLDLYVLQTKPKFLGNEVPIPLS